jgi:hypothetical protein
MSAIINLAHATGLIVARLQDQLPAGTQVQRMSDFANIEFSAWPAPAVYVLYGDLSSISPPGSYTAIGEVLIQQTFHVVAVVDNNHAVQGGGGPDEVGGLLAAQCIKALHNWAPDDRYDPLLLQPGIALDFAPGRLMFPMSFKTETALDGHYDPDQ